MRTYEKNFTFVASDIKHAIEQEIRISLDAEPVLICLMSNHPDDNYLYRYIAKQLPIDSGYIAGYANVSRSYGVGLYGNHYGVSFKEALEITADGLKDLNHKEDYDA